MLKGNLADIIKLLEHARKSKKKEEELNFELDELLNKKENKRKIDQFKELIERSHKHFEDIDFKSMKQCILF